LESRLAENLEENESLRRTLEESENEQVRALTARIEEVEAERDQTVSRIGRTQSQLDKKAKEVEA
jgi:hypothetical protein